MTGTNSLIQICGENKRRKESLINYIFNKQTLKLENCFYKQQNKSHGIYCKIAD